MDYYLLGEVNLAFQTIILAVLLTSLVFMKRGRFFSHGAGMLIAVVLNAVSFFVVMGPSLVGRISIVEVNPIGRISLVIVMHATVGSIAEVLGVWIVASWHLRSSTQKCATRRKVMLLTAVLWVIAISLGFLLFAYVAGLIS